MAKVHGNCDGWFQEVRALLKRSINSGEELGASITINIDGEELVDIWGGYADKSQTHP